VLGLKNCIKVASVARVSTPPALTRSTANMRRFHPACVPQPRPLTSAGCWAPLFAFLADAAKRLAKYTGHKNWGRHSFSSVVPAGQASAIGAQLGAVCLLAIPAIRSEFGSTVDKSGGTVLNALAAESFAVISKATKSRRRADLSPTTFRRPQPQPNSLIEEISALN